MYNVVKKTCGIVVGIQSKINMTGFISGDRDAAKLSKFECNITRAEPIKSAKQCAREILL